METQTINIILTKAAGEWTATARLGTEYAGFATSKSKKQAEADARAIAEHYRAQLQQQPTAPAAPVATTPAGRQGGPARLGSFGMYCHISDLPAAASTAAAAALRAGRRRQQFDEVSALAVVAA